LPSRFSSEDTDSPHIQPFFQVAKGFLNQIFRPVNFNEQDKGKGEGGVISWSEQQQPFLFKLTSR
jgi:hypothetical protein